MRRCKNPGMPLMSILPVGPDAHFVWMFKEKWYQLTEEQREKIRQDFQRDVNRGKANEKK